MNRLLLALALVTPIVHAGNDMAPADWARQGAITALMVADYAQTVDIYRRPTEYHEVNVMVRQHWSESGIRNYFVASIAVNAAVTRALPADWRPAWQYGYLAFEALTVLHNRRVGLHFQFK